MLGAERPVVSRLIRHASILLTAMLLASPLAVTPASADYQSDSRDCFAVGYGGEKRVAACTRVIESGRLRGSGLAGAYQTRAEGYRIVKKYDEALADFARAIEIDPQLALTYSNRAEVHRMLGNYEAVISDTTRAIVLDSTINAAYTLRGLAYEHNGDYAKARADFNTAIKLPPKGADGQWAQDVARTELKRMEDK